MDVIELSTGHVFAPGSVKVVGPLGYVNSNGGEYAFELFGVGFKVAFRFPWDDFNSGWLQHSMDDPGDDDILQQCRDAQRGAAETAHREAIDKLLSVT